MRVLLRWLLIVTVPIWVLPCALFLGLFLIWHAIIKDFGNE